MQLAIIDHKLYTTLL